jgi:hypothetical protein
VVWRRCPRDVPTLAATASAFFDFSPRTLRTNELQGRIAVHVDRHGDDRTFFISGTSRDNTWLKSSSITSDSSVGLDRGQQRVLERADEHGLVEQRIPGAPQLPDLRPVTGQRDGGVTLTNSRSKYGFAADSPDVGIALV